MSHWKKFESKVLEDINREMLKEAIENMNKIKNGEETPMHLEMDKTISSIRNSWGNERVDAGLRKNGKAIALGFNFKDSNGKEVVELSGDFYSTGLVESTFMEQLSQVYQKYNIINKLEENGWTVDDITINKNDEIVINAYEWA